MSLLAALHTRWAADATLEALLAAANVTTGRNATDTGDEPTRPYGTVNTQPAYSGQYTTGGKYTLNSVQFVLYGTQDDLDELEAIIAAMRTTFDNVDFSIDADEYIVLMRQTGQAQYLQDDANQWYAVIDFAATVREG